MATSDLIINLRGSVGEDKPTSDLIINLGGSVGEDKPASDLIINLEGLVREGKPTSGLIITLEGLVGAGKTTIGTELQNRKTFWGRPVKFLVEYENHPFLQLYLKDRKRYAFPFQMVILMSRFNTHREARFWANQGYCVVIDRGLAGDMAFALLQKQDGCFTDEEWDIYLQTFEKHIKEPLISDLILYLDCSVEISLERISKRNRPGEVSSYTRKYLEDLRDCHLKAFDHCKKLLGDKFPLTFFDWNANSLNLSGEFKRSSLSFLEQQLSKLIPSVEKETQEAEETQAEERVEEKKTKDIPISSNNYSKNISKFRNFKALTTSLTHASMTDFKIIVEGK